MILIIDNYDSFTYNLVHLVATSLHQFRAHGTESAPGTPKEYKPVSGGDDLVIRRNDQISLQEIKDLSPAGILISPGPGRPEDSGISRHIVSELSGDFRILGVCLGHQIIGECFGGVVTYAPTLMHGKTSIIRHDGRAIFEGVTSDFVATRYHSLVVSADSIPDALLVSATTPEGVVMGLRHQTLPVEGIQFHPESILTSEGPKIIANWVESCLQDQNSIAPGEARN